jgi:hypothetical protein
MCTQPSSCFSYILFTHIVLPVVLCSVYIDSPATYLSCVLCTIYLLILSCALCTHSFLVFVLCFVCPNCPHNCLVFCLHSLSSFLPCVLYISRQSWSVLTVLLFVLCSSFLRPTCPLLSILHCSLFCVFYCCSTRSLFLRFSLSFYLSYVLHSFIAPATLDNLIDH